MKLITGSTYNPKGYTEMRSNDNHPDTSDKDEFTEEKQIEKLQTASYLIKEVLYQSPDIYWKYARSNLTFPIVLLRPSHHSKYQFEFLTKQGLLPTGRGNRRNPNGEYNRAVDLAYSQILSIKIQLIMDKGFMESPLPELALQIDSLPDLSMDTLKQWETPFIGILDILIETNVNLAKSLEKKARESLMGKTDSPSAAVIKAEIRAEFKKAIRRFVKERASLLSEE